MKTINFIFIYFLLGITIGCNKENIEIPKGKIQLTNVKIGTISLLEIDPVVPNNLDISLIFNTAIDPESNQFITINNQKGESEQITFENLDNNKIINISHETPFINGEKYVLNISDKLIGEQKETFAGVSISFQIEQLPLDLIAVIVDDVELSKTQRNLNIPLSPKFKIILSDEISENVLSDEIVLVGNKNYSFELTKIGENTYQLTPDEKLKDFSKINLLLPSTIGTAVGRIFQTVSYELYTTIDTIPKFPLIDDEELLELVQKQTFKYFWEFGHPVSGLARERNTSGDVVTSGGSGFGLMSMIVGVERGFISRPEAIARWKKIFNFLENAERFHGAWSHWINGVSGKVQPFSAKDDGADLVETAFLVQGMIAVRQYLNIQETEELELYEQIDRLWKGVEWNWFTKNNENVLYWHWSPNYSWDINLKIRGHNETQIVYILAASAPNHSISKEVYEQGYANSGGIKNGNTYYGNVLPLGEGKGGPLFFTHYSYLGLDPRNLQDKYANYWDQNVNHSLINQAYCIDNPLRFVGYSAECWGLTASDGNNGYSAHSPNNDKGVITPTAAISSIPYTPDQSLAALRHFYYQLGDRLWGEFGFYDAFNPTFGWVANSYLAIDQGPIICMIENYRSGLLWDLFMSAPEIKAGLDKLDFNY